MDISEQEESERSPPLPPQRFRDMSRNTVGMDRRMPEWLSSLDLFDQLQLSLLLKRWSTLGRALYTHFDRGGCPLLLALDFLTSRSLHCVTLRLK
jgi:hypothetical protein